MKALSLSIYALAVSATAVLAGDPNCLVLQDSSCATVVPEISAQEGTAVLAAIAAILMLAWEGRARARA